MPALTYLQTLQQTPGALAALQALTGNSLPTMGTLLTTAQIQFLYTQLFDANGKPQTAYTNPTQAAQAIQPALTYLQTLQQTPGALTALQALTGNSLPTTGTLLTTAQIQTLYTQLFDANGNPTLAYNSATQGQAVANVVAAAGYLSALQANNGAGINALNALTGQSLPTSGSITGTPDQITSQIQFLFTQLFDVNGNKTLAYDSATQGQAVANVVAAAGYLSALQANNGAGINALNALTGQSLPTSGSLTGTPDQITAQIQFLFTQLFDVNGNKTLAYNSATQDQAVDNVIAAAKYLSALQANNGAGINALNALTGQSLPTSGSFTGTPDQITSQIQFLFTQLFDVNGNKTLAYDSATQGQAVANVVAAAGYLSALQANNGAGINALNALTGQSLPTSGSFTGTPDQITSQIQFLFTQLFDVNGNKTLAYDSGTQSQAVANVVAAAGYLSALQANNGAGINALNALTGRSLPLSGPLYGDY